MIEVSNEGKEFIIKRRLEGATFSDIQRELAAKGEEVSYYKVKDTFVKSGFLSPRTSKGKNIPQVMAKLSEEEKEIIYLMRKNGSTFTQISTELRKIGYTVSRNKAKEVCDVIFEERGEEPLGKGENAVTKAIYEMYVGGFSPRMVLNALKSSGIEITENEVKRRIVLARDQYGATAKGRKNVERQNMEDRIYKMRKSGLSYKSIAKELQQSGEKISWQTVERICSIKFAETGESEPKLKTGPKANSKKTRKTPKTKNPRLPHSFDDMIYTLRESGETYSDIAKKVGYSAQTITSRCKKIYSQKGKTPPLKYKNSNTRSSKINISEQDLRTLREKGYTFLMIADYYESKGIRVTDTTIRKRCNEIFGEGNVPSSRIKRKRIESQRNDSKEDLESLQELELRLKSLLETKQKSGELYEEYLRIMNDRQDQR